MTVPSIAFAACFGRLKGLVAPRQAQMRLLCQALLVLGMCLVLQAASARDLVVARISDSPAKHLAQLAPMAEYLASRLGAHGITGSRVLIAEDYDELLQMVQEQRVDWITETLLVAAQLVRDAQAQPVLRKWKGGHREYSGLVFVRKDSGIESLEQLRGRTLALEEPDSFSGYFLPLLLLHQAGLKGLAMVNVNDTPPADAVGHVFAHSESNVAQWVHKRLTDAGAFSSLDWSDASHLPPSIAADLQVIAQTPPFPRALELVAPHLEPTLVQAIAKILLGLTEGDQGELLHSYEKATGFEPVDQDVDIAIQAVIHHLDVQP